MKSSHFLSSVMLAAAAILTACAPAPAFRPTEAVVLPSPTASPQPTVKPLSFSAATYRDEAEGFQVDYPADWSVTPSTVIGPRGSQAQLLSPGTTAASLPAGGSRVSINVNLWDPRNDLASYAAHRRTAWDSGGSKILKEASGDLRDGRKYMSFVVQGPDGSQVFLLLTGLGEKYLEIAGEGDLKLVEEIALTARGMQ